jgi:hypothetical protein
LVALVHVSWTFGAQFSTGVHSEHWFGSPGVTLDWK